MRKYILKRYHKRMALAHKRLGGKCAKCRKTKRLEIDHIDPLTKSFTLAKMWSISKANFNKELAKCQLLCKHHHKKKSLKEFKRRHLNEGISNGNAKLTEKQVKEIRRLWPFYSQRQLAKKFRVSHPTIGDIVNRKSYKNVLAY